MKIKAGVITFFMLIVFSAFAPKVSSQEIQLSEFQQAYRAYELDIEEYKKAHETYVLKRAQYLRFQTLLSQDEANDATIAMLQSRDQVTIAYFRTLRKRIEEAEGIDESKKNELYIIIEQEIGWYEDHKNTLPSALTLNELVIDSNIAKARYTTNTSIFYEIISYVSTGKLVKYHERLTKIFEGVKAKSNEIQGEEREEYQLDDRKLGLIDQWGLETQARIDRSNQKFSEINDRFNLMGGKGRAVRGSYDLIVTDLNQTRQYLKEAGSFIKEILKEIMTAN